MTDPAKRIVATLLVLVVLFVTNAAAMVLVYARGLEFLVGPWGALAQLPFTVALGIAVAAILGKFRGFRGGDLADRRPGAWSAGLLATVVGLALPIALSFLLVAFGHGAMSFGSVRSTLVWGTLSLCVNAAFQQLGLLGLALAASPTPRISPGSIALASTLFTATHLANGTAPAYLSNVFLFGVACCLLFTLDGGAAWSRAIGFHAGTNVATTLVSGGAAEHTTLALLGWRGLDATWSGGDAGLESGLALLGVNVVLVGVFAAMARRRGAGRAGPITGDAGSPRDERSGV